jgi:hypothetical protein
MTIPPRLHDIAQRALRTFAQAAVATASVTLTTGADLDAAGVRALVVGALAAGISAAWNAVVGPAVAELVPPTPPTDS